MSAHHRDMRAKTRRPYGLVGSLASGIAREVVAHQRFPFSRQAGNRCNKIEIDTSNYNYFFCHGFIFDQLFSKERSDSNRTQASQEKQEHPRDQLAGRPGG